MAFTPLPPWPRPDKAPPSFHVLVKPTGAACNLACAYCFYLDKSAFYAGGSFRMSNEVLEQYICQIIEAHQEDVIDIAWQGGEPTLMGLDFYRRAMALLAKYRRDNMTFRHTMQTNALLLTDAWCEFFREHDFLVGVSIDGPQALHDAYRRDKGGGGTFTSVMRGLRCLQKHGVAYNTLTTVNHLNGDHPLEVYRFLRDDVGATWMQFIPVVERIDKDGLRLYQRGTQVSERSVRPQQLGRFLSVIFDEWVKRDIGNIFVQTFEAALANWHRLPSSGVCVFDETCGRALALEHNGDLYACDHFVEPDYLLGNIQENHILELVSSPRQAAFGRQKRDALPEYCQSCDVLFACHGGCPKNRFEKTPDGELGLNYLCAGYQAFFHHIDAPMKIMVTLLRHNHHRNINIISYLWRS